MRNLSRLFLALAFPLLLTSAGCGRVNEVLLVPPEVLTWGSNSGLDHVYHTDRAPQLRGSRIEVELLDPRQTLPEGCAALADPDWDWTHWHAMLEAATADALYQTRIFNDVAARTDPGPMPDPDYAMVLAITEWEPGNRWLRYFFGFGLGRTRMQVEAKFRETKTGHLPILFADAREHPGGPSTFPIGFKALKTESLMREDINGMLIDIQEMLCDVTGTPFAPLDPQARHLKYHPRLEQSPIPGAPAQAPTPAPPPAAMLPPERVTTQ